MNKLILIFILSRILVWCAGLCYYYSSSSVLNSPFLREAKQKVIFFSVPATKREGGSKGLATKKGLLFFAGFLIRKKFSKILTKFY